MKLLLASFLVLSLRTLVEADVASFPTVDDCPVENSTTVGMNTFPCWSCQGGPSTPCGQASANDLTEDCSGRNAQCYEARIGYQFDTLDLVVRRCWTPPSGSRHTNFCEYFGNTTDPRLGRLRYCRTCTTDSCNGNVYFLNYS